MIIEDDVEFEDKFFEKLDKVWLSDFDALFLNATDGIHRKPTVFNENLLKCNESYGLFGYVLNKRFFDTVIEWFEREQYPADKVFSMFMSFYKVYKLRTPLIYHLPGQSDIQGIIPKNYKHLERGR